MQEASFTCHRTRQDELYKLIEIEHVELRKLPIQVPQCRCQHFPQGRFYKQTNGKKSLQKISINPSVHPSKQTQLQITQKWTS
mgnify:CR=1|jgi:hypothetical protein